MDIKILLDSAHPDLQNVGAILDWWKYSQREYVRLEFVDDGNGAVGVECVRRDGRCDFWAASTDDER